MITHTIKGRPYTYYTLAEAQEFGVPYVDDWREGLPGQMVKTDDGHVVPVIRSSVSKATKLRWVRIPTGTFNGNPGTEMTTEVRDNRSSFTGKYTNFKDPDRRLSPVERRFVIYYLEVLDVQEAYQKASKAADPNKPNFRRGAYTLATRANVRKAIENGIRERMKGVGIHEEWFGEELKKLVENAARDTDKLKALELVAKVLTLVGSKEDSQPKVIGIVARQEIRELQAERQETLESGRDVSQGSSGETSTATGDVPRHGEVREVDVPVSPVEADTALPQRDL